MIAQPDPTQELIYPDSDGQPMSDNTEQFRWIVIIKENLEILYANDPYVFIAGDLLWYPVQGSLERAGPDVMVVFGRSKGRRGSYKQWEEDGIAPHVVFEILSPGNKTKRGWDSLEMKLNFYETYDVEEYYIYDPDDMILEGWLRQGSRLQKISQMQGWVSPRLGIRFDWEFGEELQLYRPDGERFLSSVELDQRAREAQARAREVEHQNQRLREQLRSLGIDPDIESSIVGTILTSRSIGSHWEHGVYL